MEWPKIGAIGALLLAAYLIVVGLAAIIGGTHIPPWATGSVAVAAGVLILVGR